MNIPTTKEELEMLFKTIHDDCQTPAGHHCDLTPLVDLLQSSKDIEACCSIIALVDQLNPRYAMLLAVCHGIKVGFQIRNPEVVKV